MKKSNERRSLRSLLPVLLIMGLFCLPAKQALAQTPQSDGQQAYNWKPASEVKTIMIAQVNNLNQQMPGFTEGTTLYDNTLRRVAYFKAIIYEIDRDEPVAAALENALPAAATLGYSKEASYTSKVVLRALLQEARTMLTN